MGLALSPGCSDDAPSASDLGAHDAGSPPDAAGLDAATDAAVDAGDAVDAAVPDTGAELPDAIEVRVTLGGAPVAGARVSYGGSGVFTETSSDGRARVALRPRSPGPDAIVTAAHPEARTEAIIVAPGDTGPREIPLSFFDRSDNLAYRFADPGEPTRRDTTGQCAHCHVTLNEAWFGSVHRSSAQNPVVHDLYAGAAAALGEAACREAGGAWVTGRTPGGAPPRARCYLGDGLLQTVNSSCGSPSCDDASELGECAACHAPGIDGELEGRGLLEAEDRAYDYGVHCDVCHRVESVPGPSAGPGVAGALALLRPSEDGAFGLGEDGWLPLIFGPSWDSPNPRMGSVPRPHFRSPELCAGCHEYGQAVLVPGRAIDLDRWPSGQLPVHSTWSEWDAGPHAPGTPCQACHMPPDPAAENGADLQLVGDGSIGIAAGWPRPPGAVRSHAFIGPRTEGAGLLELAATLELETTRVGAELEVRATVTNVGAGHAIPTGEPSRQLFLQVEARCGGSSLAPSGGEVIGALGGYETRRARGEDLSMWPGARVGDRVRAVAVGAPVDYDGVGPFARGGRFAAADKGKPALTPRGEVEIVAVDGRGQVTFDAPLPDADLYFRVRPAASGPAALAGVAGTSFARVLVGADGALAVPHHAAVELLRDDRLPPRGERSSRHRFRTPAGCAPEVSARLLYRPWPRRLSLARGWGRADRVIAEARR